MNQFEMKELINDDQWDTLDVLEATITLHIKTDDGIREVFLYLDPKNIEYNQDISKDKTMNGFVSMYLPDDNELQDDTHFMVCFDNCDVSYDVYFKNNTNNNNSKSGDDNNV